MAVLVVALTLALAGAAFVLMLGERSRYLAVRRLREVVDVPSGRPEPAPVKKMRVFPARYRTAPPIAAAAGFALLRFIVHAPTEVSVSAGLLIGVLTYLIEDHVADQRAALIESQLAASIDLLVGSLRAGSSLLAAFESALQEAEAPLKPYLQEVAGRIRLGDDPRTAVSDLPVRIPLENFRLFATSLAIHWEVGGSLSTTLATVGRTVRDRVELARRVRAQGVEANASVGVVFLLAYVLGFLMWRANPDRLEALVNTGVGTELMAAVILLQAVGLVWMSRLSRSTF